MLMDNLINFYPGRKLDGCYISINSNKLLFEKAWGGNLSIEISRGLKELVVLENIV